MERRETEKSNILLSGQLSILSSRQYLIHKSIAYLKVYIKLLEKLMIFMLLTLNIVQVLI